MKELSHQKRVLRPYYTLIRLISIFDPKVSQTTV